MTERYLARTSLGCPYGRDALAVFSLRCAEFELRLEIHPELGSGLGEGFCEFEGHGSRDAAAAVKDFAEGYSRNLQVSRKG